MKHPKTKIVFGILVALGLILYLDFRGPKLKEAVVSPVVRYENHNASAKVVRREERFFEPGEPDHARYYRGWMVVTTPEGQDFETRLDVSTSSIKDEDIKEQRGISYELSWDDSGKSLIWSNTAGKEGTAYFTGNSVLYSPNAIMVGEKAQPLTDEIKQKMQVHPDMMEASASLSGYVVLTDGFREDVINLREDVLLLARPSFSIVKGTLMSFGPVIVEENGDIELIKAATWVFLEGDSNRINRIAAERVYALESDFLQSGDWKKDKMFEDCKEFILVSRKDLSDK